MKLFYSLNWVRYHLIELHLLYKTVYISLHFELIIQWKTTKYCIRWHDIKYELLSILINSYYHTIIFRPMILSYCDTYNSWSNDIIDINLRCPEVNITKLNKRVSISYGTTINYFEHDILWNTIYEDYWGERRSKVMFVYYLSHIGYFSVYFYTQDIRGYQIHRHAMKYWCFSGVVVIYVYVDNFHCA